MQSYQKRVQCLTTLSRSNATLDNTFVGNENLLQTAILKRPEWLPPLVEYV